MSVLIAFVLGVVADILRSAVFPASNKWIERQLPWVRDKQNLETNLLALDVVAKLKANGYDTALLAHAHKGVHDWTDFLLAQREAAIAVEVALVESGVQTQADMNQEAFQRQEIAWLQMKHAFQRLVDAGNLSDSELADLHNAQKLWVQFAEANARFARGGVEGGTMAPMVEAENLASSAISRIAELNQQLSERVAVRG